MDTFIELGKCTKCNLAVLADGSPYFTEESGGLVHAKCMISEPCGICGKDIIGSYISTQDKYFHANCFRCRKCNEALRDRYGVREEKFFCEYCINPENDENPKAWVTSTDENVEEKKASTTVNTVLIDGDKSESKQEIPESVKAEMEKHKAAATTSGSSNIDGDDGSIILKTCVVCSKNIHKDAAKVVNVGSNSYHAGCFCCNYCKKPFDDGRYAVIDDNPYHIPCSDIVIKKMNIKDSSSDGLEDSGYLNCFICKKAIESKFLTLENNNYHSECYKCGNCKVSLVGQRVNCLDGIPHCLQCKNDVKTTIIPGNKEKFRIDARSGEMITDSSENNSLDHNDDNSVHVNEGHCITVGSSYTGSGSKFASGSSLAHKKNVKNPDQSNSKKCIRCHKTVYEAEKVFVSIGLYHRSCFSCHICSKTLSPGNECSRDDEIVCNRCVRT